MEAISSQMLIAASGNHPLGRQPCQGPANQEHKDQKSKLSKSCHPKTLTSTSTYCENVGFANLAMKSKQIFSTQ